ncbi:callose synthase 7-like isoform X2 [Tasmannia lanceolata]|uniref:callose synthase 7-like isoform X2 n=1 Tax=Tasmannia lanceolata TaxID=3420 RepID=UPI004062F02F
MASSSGTASDKLPPKSLSRRMTRNVTMIDGTTEEGRARIDSETDVPSSMAFIGPVLRVANEIEPENPRVAYLCRFHAFEKVHNMDPTSVGRGVRQFKTYLLSRLEKEDNETERKLSSSDPGEIQKFYRRFYEEKVREGQIKRKPEEMAKNYQTASVLYEVLKTVVPPDKIDPEVRGLAKEIEHRKPHYRNYNILPLHAGGASSAIMGLPEIKAAVGALHKVDNLPKPRINPERNAPDTDENFMPEEWNESSHDLLDWLRLAFGFQKGNVRNQREHLILLLANIEMRNKPHGHSTQLDNDTIVKLSDKIFKNYISWCKYLRIPYKTRFSWTAENRQLNQQLNQQLELLYIGLYLLIWGEASNIRFMPECICYIFHNMTDELHGILNSNVHSVTGAHFKQMYHGEESFLTEVITPIYKVMRKEAERNKRGTVSHSKWGNYDDLNEYFWSNKCFKLGWPMERKADFFVRSEEIYDKVSLRGNTPVTTRYSKDSDQPYKRRRKPKTNFVEVRTFWHLFRSFDRMWIFFILAFQAMVIIAWSPSGSLTAVFDQDVFKNVLSIFITAAILNFLQATLDILLSWKAWGSMRVTQIVRYLLKFAVAAAWVVVLPIGYSSSVQNPTGLVKYFSNWVGNWQSQSFYSFAIAIYLIPNILAVLLFMVPLLRKSMERSNWRIITLVMWWAQPKLYVGRGMHEDVFSLLKYTLFWILLLISKLAFSFYVEIMPLIGPTKMITGMSSVNYEWHEFFPNVKHNIGVIVSIWAPIVLVYFMDTQIWYAIFSTVVGGIHGAFNHLGEIQTLGMLRSRFEAVPLAFSEHLVPSTKEERKRKHTEDDERKNIAKFSHAWNLFISSLREEDLISNKEKDLLFVPYSSGDITVVQWPPFLLASKIPIALDMAKDFKSKDDDELFNKIKYDPYMLSAVRECHETLRDILLELLKDDDEKSIVKAIYQRVENSIGNNTFLYDFKMSELPQLSKLLENLLNSLKSDIEDVSVYRTEIIKVLQDIMEITTQDIMSDGHGIIMIDKANPKFTNINSNLMENISSMEKVVRLHLLLTVKESAINVPMNLDARRRITFFANSLFMNMPRAPKVCNMQSFSVLTPYYREDVLYSEDELKKENEDGITVLFYLQKIYPDEWRNFLERIHAENDEKAIKEHMDSVRHWVSYRGQTLSRTVRGMMYYRQALELQSFLDVAEDRVILDGFRNIPPDINYQHSNSQPKTNILDGLRKISPDINYRDPLTQAITDIKFTYVVSCQIYGAQKRSPDRRDRICYENILNLMLMYPSLRVAYIDERDEEVKGKHTKVYYSVLVRGGDKLDEEIYRIKLPGSPTVIGEGKPENQNHAIIFTRGEALQTIDMNQDNYLEEAFKMRNVLEEFVEHHLMQRKPTILGLREHIFTGSVSSLAWFMSNQETSFVTIGQRVLANPLKVRFHYGHPDVFDRIFHITRGGISKASKTINLSEDIFSGFNSTLRGGNVTHHEYMQVGKGRDVGMNQISTFEAKVANGNGEQTLSRDVYRLGRRFDFYRMLSFYFTTVGFYFSSMEGYVLEVHVNIPMPFRLLYLLSMYSYTGVCIWL